jgi:hypothetical protein
MSSQLSAPAITCAVGHEEHLKQVVLHFVGASGIVYLGKDSDEMFEQGGHSDQEELIAYLSTP